MNGHGYRALVVSGARYWSEARRGKRPWLEVPLPRFVRELVLAARPHYFALSSLAALGGAAAVPVRDPPWARVVLAAMVAGLGWGVGQLLNDLLDREADAINAPGRAIAAGRLPVEPALGAAIAVGFAVALATVLVHPHAWILASLGIVLLIGYNAAKRIPLAGNVAHGSLMAVAASIGVVAVADERATLSELARTEFGAVPSLLFVAVTAGWYLQSNYEKDRPGDRSAGYQTTATVMSVRASAALRAVLMGAMGTASASFALLRGGPARLAMALAVGVGILSTVPSLVRDDDRAALRGYRWAVNATILCLLALAAPLLGAWGSGVVGAGALVLVHWAFARDPNP